MVCYFRGQVKETVENDCVDQFVRLSPVNVGPVHGHVFRLEHVTGLDVFSACAILEGKKLLCSDLSTRRRSVSRLIYCHVKVLIKWNTATMSKRFLLQSARG